jgi:hypothetical protein
MRGVGAWGVTASVMMALGAAVVAAGQADGESKSAPPGLLSGLFGDKSKTKAKAGADKPAPVEDKPSAANTAEAAAAEQQRQMNAVLRRMEVCDRLRMVALQSGNEGLMRQADELEGRAREIYQRQTARLPISAPLPESSGKTTDKKPARRDAGRGDAAHAKDLDEFPPTPPRRPMSGLTPLGGDFESRERDILNSTSMGRDRP